MMEMIKVEHLAFTVDRCQILRDISLQVFQGEFVGIIGPNGSGKSTLLKNIYKVHTPTSGTITLRGRNMAAMRNREAARELSVVAQENSSNFDFTVQEVVAMGRYAGKNLFASLDDGDNQVVHESLAKTAMQSFAQRSFLELSGGEKQRVLIARALAQQTEMIILDEPTNHLDMGSQIATLQLLRDTGKTILAALHDLTTAMRYCDRIYVLSEGHMVGTGPPQAVITESLLHSLYGLDATLFEHDGKSFIDFYPS